VSSRILTARFQSKGGKVIIVQCYTPTNKAEIEEKENFYEQIQAIIDKLSKRDMTILNWET
jgi:exonuclease III